MTNSNVDVATRVKGVTSIGIIMRDPVACIGMCPELESSSKVGAGCFELVFGAGVRFQLVCWLEHDGSGSVMS
ncbi:hypothetical protein Droror1_Dr00012841 [Drosera rotundifolia]